MSDIFEEVTTTGWLQRIFNSIIGVGIGIILFVASFFVLFLNEGRTNFADVARDAIVLSTQPHPSDIGKLVSVTAAVSSKRSLGDNLFLRPGKYIAMERVVEMYAWEEKKRTETKRNLGGSETKRTIYTYRKVWARNPDNSNSFKQKAGHRNPNKAIPDLVAKVPQARLSSYQIALKG